MYVAKCQVLDFIWGRQIKKNKSNFYLFEFEDGASFPELLDDEEEEFRFFFFGFSGLRERLLLFEGGVRDL